ncbi:uncharacterized protein LOC121388684 [Gigantopelta aegis]|uniref:uncharacterized protein LOC121388684 n=1 Tax=Gigantopelta aegis TaxID=1735272 RepID=UPI001B88AF2E|nr:uncharacterized protein LOC121388684 [Gigantopelta aegis]XP_041376070.1 uncharacterized protein LOC121388684 [Gigantopelta aegis]XP_041376071.1 uncharacterized protein LOC121388684 [Gigantopelta aegis]
MAMANFAPPSTVDFTDTYLTCRICFGAFQTPKTLTCLHTFCRDCLQKWINGRTDAYKRRGFTCPVCRQFATVANPTAGWADEIPTDFRLKAMLEDTSLADGSTDNTTRVRVKIPAPHRQFASFKTIEANTHTDTYRPRILDIVVLFQKDTDVTVVCDQTNACVKAFWFDAANKKEMRSVLGTAQNKENFPARLGKITEKNVVVSLYKTKKIIILDVGPQLTHNRTIDLGTFCWCLCAVKVETSSRMETRLAVSSSARDLSVVDLEGVAVTFMNVSFTGKTYLEEPHYLNTTPSGDVIVSDFGANSLICVSRDMKVQWRYKLDCPGGVCCDEEGFTYFADYRNYRVGLLSPSGEFVKTVLSSSDDVKWPTGVYYDRLSDRLYIAQSGGLIRIFQQIT